MSESHEIAQQAEYVEVDDATAPGTEPSVILDEDRLDADPLEDGMDTAEDYSRTVKLGGTLEADDQDAIAHRLPQEEPDVTAETPPEVPIAARPATDLDETVDDAANGVDGVDGVGEPAGPAVDDEVGWVAPVHEEAATEGAEQQALHVERES